MALSGQTESQLDMEMINQLKDIMEDDFNTLVHTYLSDGKNRIDQLQQAIIAKNAESIRSEAHGFKGSSLNLGAVGLGRLLAQMEEFGHTNTLTTTEELLEQIKASFAQVQIQLLDLN